MQIHDLALFGILGFGAFCISLHNYATKNLTLIGTWFAVYHVLFVCFQFPLADKFFKA